LAKKTKSKPTKTKEVKAKKTEKPEKAEKGERYYCETCGCEVVCIEPSTEAIVCCNEPMLLVCE
jgi:ribosomal 30S subunit maturation factor RimM